MLDGTREQVIMGVYSIYADTHPRPYKPVLHGRGESYSPKRIVREIREATGLGDGLIKGWLDIHEGFGTSFIASIEERVKQNLKTLPRRGLGLLVRDMQNVLDIARYRSW